MGSTIQQVLTALTTFPGNLIYHMALAFSIAGALQMAVGLWRDSALPQGRRMVIGLGLMLGLRFLLFLCAGLAQSGLYNPRVLLPILDRAATTLSLIVILWLWVFPEPRRLADAASSLLGMLTAAIAAISWAWWFGNYSALSFNASWLDFGWEFLAIALLGLGFALLILRRPNGWEYGLGMMIVVSLGHLLHLIVPQTESDYPGFVRLAQMAAYPILFSLPRRFRTPQPEIPAVEAVPAPSEQPAPQEKSRSDTQPEYFKALLFALGESTGPELCKAIARTLAETMRSDICLIVSPPGRRGRFHIQCGYDFIHEETLENLSLDQGKLPLLTSAMKKAQSLRLPARSTSQDLTNLGDLLGLGSTGHLLAGSVQNLKGETALGIILLSPHTDRRWAREDQDFIEEISNGLAPILHQARRWEAAQKELEKTQNSLHALQEILEEVQAENQILLSERDTITKEVLGEEGSKELDSLRDDQQQSQDTIARLQVENRRLGEMVESLIAAADTHELTTSGQLKKELREALEEIANLKNQLIKTEQQALVNAGVLETADTVSEERAEVFASIAQDLRQPMSSIVGYTELLLGESVGILGALQRKFLERIRASTERLERLLDDLLRVATLLAGDQLQLNPEAVDLGNAFDKAIANTSAQMREKNIILRVDLPEPMPHIHADRDALQQILIHLLKNAGTVSPVEGEIFLRAEVQDVDDGQNYVLIQVADQGGGIPKEDLPRVFSRLYRADNPLIEGIGDTGVGLSIAKTLVESQEGRIWVDTETGKGSAFNILLPLYNGETTPQSGEGHSG